MGLWDICCRHLGGHRVSLQADTPEYSGFLNQNLRVFFWRGQEQVTIAKFVSLGDWNMQVYVRFGP